MSSAVFMKGYDIYFSINKVIKIIQEDSTPFFMCKLFDEANIKLIYFTCKIQYLKIYKKKCVLQLLKWTLYEIIILK